MALRLRGVTLMSDPVTRRDDQRPHATGLEGSHFSGRAQREAGSHRSRRSTHDVAPTASADLPNSAREATASNGHSDGHVRAAH